MERRKISLLDQGEIIGLKSGGKSEREKSVPVLGIFREPDVRKILGAANSVQELSLYLGIGTDLGTIEEYLVVFIKLPLENAKPIELGKEKSGGLAHRSDGVVRVLHFIRRKITLSSCEVKVVETIKAAIERGSGRGTRQVFGAQIRKEELRKQKARECRRAQRFEEMNHRVRCGALLSLIRVPVQSGRFLILMPLSTEESNGLSRFCQFECKVENQQLSPQGTLRTQGALPWLSRNDVL